MSYPEVDARLVSIGLPKYETLLKQIYNNGSLNFAMIRNLTGQGIIVKVVFGENHPEDCLIGLDFSLLEKDVSNTPFQVNWPRDIASVLNSRGLLSPEALSQSSILELKLLPGMTPRMLETIMKELHSRQVFIKEFPSAARRDIVLSTSVECLNLTRRVEQILIEERIYTLALLTTWTADGLTRLSGLGISSVQDINRKLEQIGLSLNKNGFHGYSNSRGGAFRL